jgi:hypothetical protein
VESPDATVLRHGDLQRRLLEQEIRQLEVLADVRFWFSWPARKPPRQVHGGNELLGALVVQLEQVVCKSQGAFTCQACGIPEYGAGRRGPYKYCRDCGLRGAWRTNKRHERQEASLARDLHAKGKPQLWIAKELAARAGLTDTQFLEEKEWYLRRVQRFLRQPR